MCRLSLAWVGPNKIQARALGPQKPKPAQALGSGHGFVHVICREPASWEITISGSKNMHDVLFYNCLLNYSLILTLMSEIARLKIFWAPHHRKLLKIRLYTRRGPEATAWGFQKSKPRPQALWNLGDGFGGLGLAWPA